MRNWDDLVGERVNGLYLGLVPFRGLVVASRVKYGGKVQHTIELAEPITFCGQESDRILVEGDNINRILDERDAEYAASINDSWYDDQHE